MKKPLIFTLLLCVSFALPAKAQPISEVHIQNSVLDHYPLILAGYDKIKANQGKLKASQGAFDIMLKQEYLDYSRGFYDGKSTKTTIEKQNQFLGSRVYGGYRKSYGDFESYNNGRQTAHHGEFFAGLNLPLLQGRAIDQNRLGVMLAEYDFDESKVVLDKIKITIQQDALKAYWNWIAAAKTYHIYDDLYTLSVKRDKQLREKQKKGDIAQIIVTENKKNLLTRQNQALAAQVAFKNSAIYLSLFYRDTQGQPIILSPDNLPEIDFENLNTTHNLEEDIELAQQNRAEIALLKLDKNRQKAALDYSKNLLQPKLDVNVEASKDIGSAPNTLSQSRNSIGAQLSLPLQFSQAKGKINQAKSSLSAIAYEEKNLQDTIKAELEQIHHSIITNTQMLQNLKEEVALAQELEAAERKKFELGASNFFIVNLREQISADSKIKKIDAWQKLQNFKTDYKAARFAF